MDSSKSSKNGEGDPFFTMVFSAFSPVKWHLRWSQRMGMTFFDMLKY
jgi:hypothetical protein